MTVDPDLLAQAVERDAADPLAALRQRFVIPTTPDGQHIAYFAGNSLGLMPHAARDEVQAVMDNWATHAVEGHFEDAAGPRDNWYRFASSVVSGLEPIVGAAPGEVAVMASLTENLHFLLASFYRPTAERNLLVIEADAFPSDRYMATSHVQWHGLDPEAVVYELGPNQLDADGFAAFLTEHGHRVATVLLGGVNYLTGTVLPMQAMTQSAHAAGAMIGFDLAHAVGNVELLLHDWDVDFASWCSYKYLNAGPGAIAGIFVHDRHGQSPTRHRLAGWWGNDPATRFDMDTQRDFVPAPGADGFKISNPSILSIAPLRASVEIFAAAGAARLEKSRSLTAYLRALLEQIDRTTITTPAHASGAQISVRIEDDAARVQERLMDYGVLCDMRPPDVLRFAPTALYNTYGDVARAAVALDTVLNPGS